MGSLFGGPTVTKVPAPAPLFPGLQQSYINSLQQSGINTAALNTLTQAATTGLPTDVGPAFDAFKAAAQRNIQEGATNVAEKFGGGMAPGSDLFKAGVDYESQAAKDLNAQLAQWSMAASEAAAGRRMGAATTGAQLVADPALAFRQTGVVTQQPGLLGGLGSLFSSLFPKFDLGTLFPPGSVFNPNATRTPPFGGGTVPAPTISAPPLGPGAYDPTQPPYQIPPSPDVNVNLDYGSRYPGPPGYVDPYMYPPPDLPPDYGGGDGGDFTEFPDFA